MHEDWEIVGMSSFSEVKPETNVPTRSNNVTSWNDIRLRWTVTKVLQSDAQAWAGKARWHQKACAFANGLAARQAAEEMLRLWWKIVLYHKTNFFPWVLFKNWSALVLQTAPSRTGVYPCPCGARHVIRVKCNTRTLECEEGKSCKFSERTNLAWATRIMPRCETCFLFRKANGGSVNVQFSPDDLDTKDEEGFGSMWFICSFCHSRNLKVSAWCEAMFATLSRSPRPR